MGNIKHTFIKRTGNEIYEKYTDRVSNDFDKNKALLDELIESGVLECRSKTLRNKLAGYLSTKTGEGASYIKTAK
ncbi:MAG: 30S ribosomal protein S17e [Candidatus Undinarchaeales archaeon]